ncbi:MAG: Gx transporter family protein [Eubacteriales bacterium]|nr:Gx transporter family protein [Eubacteriales bacterium]
MSIRKRTQWVAICALLLSLTLILGYVESLIPIAPGVPGIKLGLSNSVLLLSLYLLGVPTSLMLMALKVFLSGVLFSGFSAMMYSFAGGVLSLLAMILLSRIKGLSPIVVSAVGGLMHNVGQVALAMVILNTSGLVYYMAILMAVGLVTGAATGTAFFAVMKHLKKLGWKFR